MPVCVRFSASRPDHARAIADAGADGVIIGSILVAMTEGNLDAPRNAIEQISQFLTEVKAALCS